MELAKGLPNLLVLLLAIFTATFTTPEVMSVRLRNAEVTAGQADGRVVFVPPTFDELDEDIVIPVPRKRPWALPDPLYCCLLNISCCRKRDGYNNL
ncbi:unnamed protein product [Mesocestoides corti]|uniref:Conotoxin n=1 Tax=Mesocestoides corti TaxID=53468 RepID=A0A0R3UP94_MESCO|nr:unnamed protein product [Mesocestoides corti]